LNASANRQSAVFSIVWRPSSSRIGDDSREQPRDAMPGGITV
jgi:hypothetical protein